MTAKKRYYDRLIQTMRCARCGEPNSSVSSTYCDKCRQYMREYQKWVREKRKAEREAARGSQKKKPDTKRKTGPVLTKRGERRAS